MRLVLVRHGLSVANLKGLVTGTPLDDLSPAGIEQVDQTRRFLERIDFQAKHFFTSQWLRAQHSARILFPDAYFQVDPRLGETHAGSVADIRLPDFLVQQPDFYANHLNRYPDGETHAELNRRVLAWLQDIQEQCTGTVVAVTHAGPIACLLQHALGIPMERFPSLIARNASLSVIDYASGDDAGKLVLFSQLPESAAKTLIGVPA
ncbi:MAG TPA: histidine phosphatase family protein [Hydrogenophaga sp.]|uniref:histidine phosphatase family protein n=1 Tax=Hydrogenophaga sp. TaxID=1904254 RepID=UPI0008BC13B6|nr:histidine phosphatase family protein [Hydrogenophaga sp.]OGA76561.1 MAG: hypothetical protein A2X73_19855 [Burkholderiales bacterium GWE1_65_30]OGA91477.1 MAG: hypothetical protein A2X72_04760 [Burkholderiales bacterium GWF1_66_17]HAX19795.1 histidine phosphatase family protein [Hydrogenophaga sp.]HBU20147.1 histidine phosphatase family protein [Hydrogenophaga sp.]